MMKVINPKLNCRYRNLIDSSSCLAHHPRLSRRLGEPEQCVSHLYVGRECIIFTTEGYAVIAPSFFPAETEGAGNDDTE
jgi:hypothetical protein